MGWPPLHSMKPDISADKSVIYVLCCEVLSPRALAQLSIKLLARFDVVQAFITHPPLFFFTGYPLT